MLIRCNGCNKKLQVRDEIAGKKVKCPKCTKTFRVPALAAAVVTMAHNDVLPATFLVEVTQAPHPDTPVHVRPVKFSGECAGASTPKLEDFTRDLRLIHRTLPLERQPGDCLARLADIFERQRNKRAERANHFQTDLKQIYREFAFGYDEAFLPKLEVCFESMRRAAKSEIAQYSLDEDDVLQCPISLFGVMQYGRLETAHTAVLAWLLDPRREHGFGDHLLRALLDHLNVTPITDSICVEGAAAEFQVDGGRLDVMVEGKFLRIDGSCTDWVMVIEAKIDADEGEDQLKTYDRWLGKALRGRTAYRVFLTPEGRSAETGGDDWKPISFTELARIFRGTCSSVKDRDGYEFLRHYLSGVLKDICHWKLPVQNPETCTDPYSFVEYLKAVNPS